MKYKLINSKTGIEHLCDKMVIDGMEYYVTYPDNCCIQKEGRTLMNKGCMERNHCERKIATTNPNIDIPKVVDEFDPIKEYDEKYLSSLTTDGKSFISDVILATRLGYNKSQETHPYSEEDVIDFATFRNGGDVIEEFKIWKEQKTKTLYYE